MDYTLAKTKTPQKKTPDVQQERDLFLTPAYATKLLFPFIPHHVRVIWDVGAGGHYIGNVFLANRRSFRVYSTDIDGKQTNIQHNFANDDANSFAKDYKIDMLVGNPPFSLKKEFIDVALGLGRPFAFLIPFDMSGYLWNNLKNKGLQAIVPERRIDFITPNVVSRANEFLGVQAVNKVFKIKAKSKKQLVAGFSHLPWEDTYYMHQGNYDVVEDIPVSLLRKVSSSDFHSFWLTYGFGLEKDFTFVELSSKDKNDIF